MDAIKFLQGETTAQLWAGLASYWCFDLYSSAALIIFIIIISFLISKLPLDQTRPALPALKHLIHSNDEEVLTDACWALSYLSDGTNDKIQSVIEAEVVPRLVELLMYVIYFLARYFYFDKLIVLVSSPLF